MPATLPASTRPAVSVIIPARNEGVCLGACLQSLVTQSGVPLEIIVVDDHSTDRTREIALSFSSQQVRVIEAGPLPAGWTGKNNAVNAGSKAATGEWMLFTDADTIHLPGSLARSLEEAKRHGASLLSYSPEQIVKSFWEKAVMPVIFAELAASYRPSQVSDPNSPAAAANGQYILITREAYDAVGGHAAIAANLLEDVALARAVKHFGRKIFFPLRRRCRPNPHVSQLRPTPRRLDQEPRTLIPHTSKASRIADNRVRPDHDQRRHRHLRNSARKPATSDPRGDPGRNHVRFLSQANPPRAFRLGCKSPSSVRTSNFFLLPAALEKRTRGWAQ